MARESRALGAHERHANQAIQAHDRASAAEEAHARMQATHTGMLELAAAFAMACFVLVLDGGGGASLASALAALVLLVRPSQALATSMQQLSASASEVERLAQAILADVPSPVLGSTGAGAGLCVTGLSVRYGERAVLDAVDLVVSPGEVVALLGPSGTGKSTLLECIAGARSRDAGSITVEGRPVAPRADVRALGLAWAPQRPAFLTGTLAENVDPRGTAAEAEVLSALREACLSELVEAITLSGEVAHAGASLSTGERARLALARAVITRPRCLVLDEPTASLDDETEAAVMRSVVERARGGAAVLVATHRASTAAHADRRFRLRHGKLEAID
jgi:ABC-type transport system involved in cytochrome bd biosynthesis fused ATPase/permease subunit